MNSSNMIFSHSLVTWYLGLADKQGPSGGFRKEDFLLGSGEQRRLMSGTPALTPLIPATPTLGGLLMHRYGVCIYFLWLLGRLLMSQTHGTWAPSASSHQVLFSCDTAADLPGFPGVHGTTLKPRLVGSHRCAWFVFSLFIV